MKAQKLLTESNKQRVCQLLGWDLADYTAYQEAKGLDYIKQAICGDDFSVDTVAQCALFWRWWVNHWNARDAEFLTNAPNWPISWYGRKYEDLNDVDGFTFWPHRIIMEQTYAYMIGQTIKEAVR